MKLVTFEVPTPVGRFERVGAITDSGIVDLIAAFGSSLGSDDPRASDLAVATIGSTMVEFLSGGARAREAAQAALDHVAGTGGELEGPRGEQVVYDIDTTRLLAPVPRPNTVRDFTGFRSHMERYLESAGANDVTSDIFDGTSRPMYYKANASMVMGPGDVIPWPCWTDQLDFEIELAVVIGRTGVNIAPEDAHDYIAGYTIMNDVSLRDFQAREIAIGANIYGVSKSKDPGGYPFGPCIVTPDELDATELAMVVRVNGEEWVRESTRDMTWRFADFVSFASVDEPIHPGDCMAGGAPPGGSSAEMGRWLKPGDDLELEIEGIGVLRNTIGAPQGEPGHWRGALTTNTE